MSLPLVNSLDSSVDALVESSWLHGAEWQPASGVPDPQVVPKTQKAQRRKFSASDKQRILAAVSFTERRAGHLLSAPTAAATTVKVSASFTTSADRSRVRRQPRGPATAGISQPPFPLTTIFTWIVIFVADSMS